MTDWQLLRRYVDDGSEAAFAQLVDRHKKLVYWTCRQEISDAQMAEDAMQAVFIVLARKASTVRREASLAGWLFSVARHVGKRSRDAERRRRQIEERAISRMETETEPKAAGVDAELWLNEALSSLPEQDRTAVLLRHYEQYSFSEIALAIGTTEEAARKRVVRSLERLRLFLTKKEVSVTTVLLAVLLTERAAKALPESCLHISGPAILKAASASQIAAAHNGSLLIKKGTKLLVKATIKKTVIAAAVVIAAGAISITMVMQLHRRNAATKAVVPGASFSDAAPTVSGADAVAARQAVDSDYASIADGMQRGGTFRADFLPEGQQLVSNEWGSSNHSMSIKVRQFEVSGASATAEIDTTMTTVRSGENPGDFVIRSSARDQWVNSGGRWVLTHRTVIGKPQATLNGGPVPAGLVYALSEGVTNY